VDKIVAVVNNEIITHLDIDKAIQFYPLLRKKNESDRDLYFSVLQDLINYKVVYLEYKDEFILSDEDFTEVQTSIIKKVGSYDKLLLLLRRFDMEWQDFKDFIKEKVAYEKVLRETFQIKINISFQEITAFYNEQYLPSQRSLRLKPKTLIEMAPFIETQLKKDRTDKTLAEWLGEITASYKIENKLLEEQEGNSKE
jgi:parvulin-like peptidyl-prolyl isomerase